MLATQNCHPINIVEDDGLREIIRIALGDTSYNLPLRGTILSRIHTLYEGERARRMNMLEQAKDAALTGDFCGLLEAMTTTWASQRTPLIKNGICNHLH